MSPSSPGKCYVDQAGLEPNSQLAACFHFSVKFSTMWGEKKVLFVFLLLSVHSILSLRQEPKIRNINSLSMVNPSHSL